MKEPEKIGKISCFSIGLLVITICLLVGRYFDPHSPTSWISMIIVFCFWVELSDSVYKKSIYEYEKANK